MNDLLILAVRYQVKLESLRALYSFAPVCWFGLLGSHGDRVKDLIAGETRWIQ